MVRSYYNSMKYDLLYIITLFVNKDFIEIDGDQQVRLHKI